MAAILFFTIVGFLAGLGYVMVKRKIQPGKLLTATVLGLVFAGIVKVLKDYYNFQGKGRRFF